MKKIMLCILISVFVTSSYAQTYEDIVIKGMDYVDIKEYAAAEQAFKAAMRKEPANPANVMLIVNLGTVLRHLGKLDEALESYNVAIENHPQVVFLRQNRALLYCDMGEFDNAMKDYNEILLHEPENTEALYRRGLLYINSKNLFAAEDDFDKITEIDAKNLLGKIGIASIMKRRNEWTEAEKLYSDLISKDKDNAELYFNRAECYLQMDKLAKTQADIAKAVDLGYESPAMYILRGQLRLTQYDKVSAKKDFLKAKEMGTDDLAIDELLKKCK